jgi:ABC-type uncharacterized transport system YnjBCD substrate-binding protein
VSIARPAARRPARLGSGETGNSIRASLALAPAENWFSSMKAAKRDSSTFNTAGGPAMLRASVTRS